MIKYTPNEVKNQMNPEIEPLETDSGPELANQFDKFARYYDGDYRNYVEDLELISALAEDCGGPVLELGCGTGRVMLPLAEQNHSVVGIDISPDLLAIARQKVEQSGCHNRVRLVQDDIRTVRLPDQNFTFAYCVSNTLMHCNTQADQIQLLQTAHVHLQPGGLLLLDLFNPDLVGIAEVAGLCELADTWEDKQHNTQIMKWSVRSLDAAEQLQETLFIYEEIDSQGNSNKTICPFTLRYLWPAEGKLMLESVGFELLSIWGDFDGTPHDSGSERLIFLAKKP